MRVEIGSEEFQNLCNGRFNFYKKSNIEILPEYLNILLPQSILGNIHSGHANFSEPIPECVFDDVCNALKLNPINVRKEREIACYDAETCFYDMLYKGKNKLTNRKGEPLFGIKRFENLIIEPNKEFFKGIAFATFMDDEYWRKETVKYYPYNLDGEPLEIGCGKEFPVNMIILEKYNLTQNDLSKNAHSEKDIEDFRRKGIIVKESSKKSSLENVFIRTQLGKGCCDDACGIGTIVLSDNPSSIYSWSIVDAMDTDGKFVCRPVLGGLDGKIGNRFVKNYEEKYKEKLVTPEEIMTVIYLGAKNNSPKIDMSSSHRKFFQKEDSRLPITLESHLLWVTEGKRPKIPCRYGFTKMSFDKFYNGMNKRLYQFGLGDKIKEEEVKDVSKIINFQKIPKDEKKKIKFEIKKELIENGYNTKDQNYSEIFNKAYNEVILDWQKENNS